MRSRKDMRAKKGTRSEEARRRVSPPQKGGEGWWWWWWRVVLTRAMRYKIAKRYGTFFALLAFFSRQKGKSRRRKMKKIPSNQKRLRWGGKTKQKSAQRTFGPPHKRATVSILEQESVEQKSAFLFSPLTQMYIFSAKYHARVWYIYNPRATSARIGRRMHLFARFARFRRRKTVARLVVFDVFIIDEEERTSSERQKYAKRRRRRKARAEKTNEKHSRDGNFLGLLGLDRGGLSRDSLRALSSGHFGCFRFAWG